MSVFQNHKNRWYNGHWCLVVVLGQAILLFLHLWLSSRFTFRWRLTCLSKPNIRCTITARISANTHQISWWVIMKIQLTHFKRERQKKMKQNPSKSREKKINTNKNIFKKTNFHLISCGNIGPFGSAPKSTKKFSFIVRPPFSVSTSIIAT